MTSKLTGDKEHWRDLPLGSWFFYDSPDCVNRYSVQERTDGGCSIVCSTPYHYPQAKRNMEEIAKRHNAELSEGDKANQQTDSERAFELLVAVRDYSVNESGVCAVCLADPHSAGCVIELVEKFVQELDDEAETLDKPVSVKQAPPSDWPASTVDSLLQPLKEACDRDWKDENPAQIVAIAANAIHWRRIAPAAQAVIEYVRRHHNSRSDKLMQMIANYDDACLIWCEAEAPRKPSAELIIRIEEIGCGCGARNNRNQADGFKFCKIHALIDELREVSQHPEPAPLPTLEEWYAKTFPGADLDKLQIPVRLAIQAAKSYHEAKLRDSLGEHPEPPKGGTEWNWISVKERLPKDHQIVMVWRNDGFPLAARYRVDHYYGGFRHGLHAIDTTHWMPVTEPVEYPSSPQVTGMCGFVMTEEKRCNLPAGHPGCNDGSHQWWANPEKFHSQSSAPVGSVGSEVKPRTGDKESENV